MGIFSGRKLPSDEEKIGIVRNDLDWLCDELKKTASGFSTAQGNRRVQIATRYARIMSIIDYAETSLHHNQKVHTDIHASIVGLKQFLETLLTFEMSNEAKQQVQFQLDAVTVALASYDETPRTEEAKPDHNSILPRENTNGTN
jgi:hypothetical protein